MRLSMAKDKMTHGTGFHCPVEATLDVIGGEWKEEVILFHLMHDDTHRFAVLCRKYPGVSERMLTHAGTRRGWHRAS